MRLIDADELDNKLEALKVRFKALGRDNVVDDYNFVQTVLLTAPTIEAAPVVHGRWIHVPSSDMITGKAYKCSECGKMRYGSYMPNYCQCCGSKMDGGVSDG